MDKQFIKIYNLIKNDIFRLAYSYTKNISDAEDITQEVFLKLYEHLADFHNEEHLKKWCIKVTINKCKNHFLSAWKRKITNLSLNEAIKSSSSFPSNDLLNAILLLPKKYRIVIILYYYNGYQIKEISQLLKVNPSTIKTRLTRARLKLELILKEEGYS